jgi:hypothetical protein
MAPILHEHTYFVIVEFSMRVLSLLGMNDEHFGNTPRANLVQTRVAVVPICL